jgi:nucleotide-binding universal stress UspA family protein
MTHEIPQPSGVAGAARPATLTSLESLARRGTKVLVAYDGSPSADAALRKVVDLFGGTAPELVLLTALPTPATTSDLAEQTFEIARTEAEAELMAAVRSLPPGEREVHLRLLEGEPRHVLERIVVEEAPDLVVVGARGRGAVGRVLLGSVSSFAVQHLKCPVLVVR